VPNLCNKFLLNELSISKYITKNYDGLEKVQELADTLHSGACLRGVIQISLYDQKQTSSIKVLESFKIYGGVHKVIEHLSDSNQCVMKFGIFLPKKDFNSQREGYPVFYFLSGLSCTHENILTKINYAEHANRHNMIVVFPDISPRNVGQLDEHWTVRCQALLLRDHRSVEKARMRLK